MDRPDLDRGLHVAALAGLARLNRWSRSSGLLWGPIRKLARTNAGRRLRVLDVASGGGDVALGLWRRAAAAGVELEVLGCDISPTAVTHAGALAERVTDRVRFEQRDVLADPPRESFDVVTCSLFLHHLTAGDAVRLLRSLGGVASRLLLINDLVRSRPGKLMADVACRVLSRSPVVRVDGPRSVEGAFTIAEARRLAADAGLTGARVGSRWPCRFLLEWEPTRER
ncbi:MAG: methyltransferase domain-containing protein [Planctomycetota bacterium]